MAPRRKADDPEIPTLTDLEAENIIVRKKGKDRRKQPFTESDAERKEPQPERSK